VSSQGEHSTQAIAYFFAGRRVGGEACPGASAGLQRLGTPWPQCFLDGWCSEIRIYLCNCETTAPKVEFRWEICPRI